MPAKKATTAKGKTSTWKRKEEPKILSATEAKMIFSSIADTFTDHYVGSHAKFFAKKSIKEFSHDLLGVYDSLEFDTPPKGPVVITAAHKADDKPEKE